MWPMSLLSNDISFIVWKYMLFSDIELCVMCLLAVQKDNLQTNVFSLSSSARFAAT